MTNLFKDFHRLCDSESQIQAQDFTLKAENAALKKQNEKLDAEWREVTAAKFLDLENTIAQQAEAIRLKDAALDWCIGEFNLRLDDIDLSQETISVLSARHIQHSPDILQARDERVAEACAKIVNPSSLTYITRGDALTAIRSNEWRKYL